MTAETRFERQLPAILEELYLGPTPDYRDEVLAVAAGNRQRPSWTFPGRWLPMAELVDLTPVAVPRLPLRTIGVALLVLSLLVAALAFVGSRSRVPPPFGPARNGLITWALDGDIYVGDPAAGTTRKVVAVDDIDRNPVFSRDGQHLAFLRQAPIQTGKFDLVVTRPDGSDATVLSAVPIPMPEAVEWAPDGRSILVVDGEQRLTSHFVDGSPSKLLLEGVHLEPDAFRPPDGAQVLFERTDDQGALWIMNADGSDAHELFGPGTSSCECAFVGPARWSPDGRSVAFGVNPDGLQQRINVIDADGGNLHQLANADGIWAENDPRWSPDGTRIAFNRWENIGQVDWPVRPIAVVDVATGTLRSVGVAPAAEGALIEWAPDGHSILSLPNTLVEAFTWSIGANGTVAKPVLIDVDNGSSRQLDWSVGSIASWQRLAP